MEGISFSKKEESFTMGSALRKAGLFLIFFLVTIGVVFPTPSTDQLSAVPAVDSVTSQASPKTLLNSNGGNASPTNALNPTADSLVNVEGQLCDPDPPYWYDHFPFAGSVDVSDLTRSIKFKLRDDRSGVDLSTLHLNIDGINVDKNSEGLNLDDYGKSPYNPEKPTFLIVTYQFPADHRFLWGDTVWIKISVCDLWKPANCMQDTVFFVIEEDAVPPEIIPEYPVDQDTGVPINSRVSFLIKDENSGIDFDSLFVKLNGNPVTPERSGDVHQARFVINAPEDSLFGFRNNIIIDISIQDSAKNPAELSYRFETAQEHYSPDIKFIYPRQDSDQTILGTDSLVFQVTDLHSGVDFDKTEIFLELNGAPVEIFDPVESPLAPNGFRYTIRPRQAFHHNDEGQLTVKAFDRAGNSNADETTFKVVQDTTPPSFSLQSPQEKAGVSPNHRIEILIADLVAGVDSKSIRLEINGLPVTDYQLSPISPKPASFVLSLPYQSAWNDSVKIQIHAADSAANADSATFIYEIIKDLQPPTIYLLAPATLTDVPLQQEVLLEISDEISGVKSDEIQIWVNEVPVTDFQIVGDANRYRVSFNHQATWNDVVEIEVKAADHATNAASATFTYAIIKDLQPPTISLLVPANLTDVPLQQEVLLEISDEISGVKSDEIQIWVNEVPVTDFQIDGDAKRYRVSFNHQAAWNDTVHLTVQAVDFAKKDSGPKPFTYRVKTDHVKPVIALLNPIPDSEVNHARQQIKLEITDDSSGVDLSKIKIWVYDQIIEGWSISGDSLKYTCEFEYLAPWDTTVSIRIQAADFAKNAQEGKFKYKTPLPGPISIILKSPQPLTAVPLQHTIEFSVKGSLAGIDSTKIFLLANGDSVSELIISRSGPNEYRGTAPYFSPWNSTVPLVISASDSANQTLSAPFDYQIVKDPVGPEISRQKPEITVGLNPIVDMEYTIRDAVSGVDPASVRLEIDGENIPINLQQNPDGSFKFLHTATLQINSTTLVDVFAKDIAGNSSHLPDSYATKKDSVPPVITAISPLPGETAVALNAPVVFSVRDTLAGVAIHSLLFKINDEAIPLSELSYTTSNFDTLVKFTYEPKTPFALEDSVWIHIGIEDKVGNKATAKDLDYYFETIEDHDQPIITLIEPDSNATGVARKHSIIFEVSDLLTGVNPASLVLRVNDKPVTPEINPIDSKRLHVQYVVDPIFSYNDTVKVEIYVEDNSVNKNNAKLTYKYYIVRDDAPPVFSDLKPAPNAVDVSCRTPFHFKISDNLAGVDLSRFEFSLDGELIPHSRMTIKGDPANYTVDFGSDAPFFPGQVVVVKLLAVDWVGNQDLLEYNFTINPVEDKTAPLIVPLLPKENDTNVARNTQFILSASDASGIDTTSAVFVVSWNDTIHFPKPDKISFDESGTEAWFSYNLSSDTLFNYNQGLITGTFSVLDLACAQNSGEKTYSFIIENDETKPEIILVQPGNLNAVPANTLFQFEIGDNETGIQIESIQLSIKDSVVKHSVDSLKKNWLTIRYNEVEPQLFEYGAQIPVEIRAVNTVGLDSVLKFTMQIVEDSTSPVIVWEHPAEGTRPPRNPELVFRLLDAETGINLENSAMVIESTINGPVEIRGIDPKGSAQYTVESVNGKFEYRVRFNPDSLRLFDYFQEVKVNLSTENYSKLESAHSASLVQDFKVIDGDTLPPWVVNELPAPEQTDVDPKTTVQFDVLDSSGVDSTSLSVSLFNISLNNSIPYQLTENTEIREARYSGYHIVATPDAGFMGYNDTIQIKIFATDVEQNAMKDTLKFQFYTVIDQAAPEIIPFSPVGDGVDLKPLFHIQIGDTLSGVDASTVEFGWKYREDTIFRRIEERCYQLGIKEVNPGKLFVYSFFMEDSFKYDRYVDLFAKAADKEGNSVTLPWQIKTRKYDEEPPWIEYIDPKPEEKLLCTQSTFSFNLHDDLSYVVKERIVVDILAKSLRDTLGLFSRDWHFQYGDSLTDVTEYSNYLVVTLTPPVDDPFQFYYNDKVEMEVRAEDAYANSAKFDTIFSTQQDLAAPYLVSSDPSDENTNNPLNTGIRLELADDLAGIQLSTLRVYLINQSRFDPEPDSADWANAEELYPDSGKMKIILPVNPVEVTALVQMEMPAGTMLFDVNRRIFLKILAEDAAVNKMDTVISFCTEEKLPDLSILTASYPPGKYVVGDTVKVTAKIANQFAVVPYAFDVTFELEGVEDAQDTVMVPGGFDAPVGKDTTGILPLNSQGKFRIVITVDKQNSVMEQDENNNNYYLNIEVHGGKLVVKSNPFTPNDDGINDDACFYCDQFKLENPCIKIFDLRGRFIKELGGNDFYDKKFRWDGRDKNGNEVMPGVFLYILQEKGQPITNGCVVVAR